MESGLRGASYVRTLVAAVVIGVSIWFGSGRLGFPFVYQVLFVGYVVLALLVYLLLESPSISQLSGWKAGITLVGLYLAVSVLYIFGTSTLPQFDPVDEKQTIAELLKDKQVSVVRDSLSTVLKNQGELLEKAKRLEGEAQSLLTRVNELTSEQRATETARLDQGREAVTLVGRGRQVYEEYECFNCHMIGGNGHKKFEGPKLDNVGNMLSVKDIKKKILDPGYLYAEGFEEEHKEGKHQMPEDYKDLMVDEELNALAAYLNTLRNPAVETPKPIFVKADVQHGFTVYGYVRDKDGKPVPNVKVEAVPQKDHAHPGSGTTNEAGYFEIFLHMHNEDAGTRVVVKAKDVKEEFVANYDPRDTQTRRQASVELVVPAG